MEKLKISDMDWYRNRLVFQNGIILFYSLGRVGEKLKFNQAITKTKEVRIGSKGALMISTLGQNYLLRLV